MASKAASKTSRAKAPAVPVRLSERQWPARLRQKYDAAATTDANRRHWANADNLGPDSALDPATRQKLRSRARYEVANDTYANGMIRTLANDTIGTGPQLQVIGLPKMVAIKIEMAFWKWSVAIRLAEKLRTMRQAKACDGESFASFFWNPKLPHRVQLDIQVHEAEMIASPLGQQNQSLTDGIILDEFGNVAGYTLLKEHPGERMSLSALEWETVPARDMIHLFNVDRAGQSRGAPEISPALPLFALRRRYTLAVLRAAELAASHAGVIQTQSTPGDPDEVEPLDTIEIEHGMYTTLPKGWGLNQMKAEQPTAVYEQFTKAIIREMARCLNMPFNVAAADSSSYNYASGRMDHQVYFKALGVERAFLELKALAPLYEAWWREARVIRGYLPAEAASLEDPPQSIWRWDGREHVDPVKDASAQTIRLSAGTTTRAHEYALQGKDVDEEDEVAARTLGLTVTEYRRRLADKLLGPAAVQQSSDTPPKPDDDEPVDPAEGDDDAE